MQLTSGQQEYLLELLSYEYVIPEEYSEAVKNAIRRYATASYTDEELDFLVSSPQSLAALLSYHSPRQMQAFANQYALWLNCLEQSIYQDDPTLEAIIINPDPTSDQKLLAVHQKEDTYQVNPVPQLMFSAGENQHRSLYHSQWSYQDAMKSLEHFMDYAHQEQRYSQLESRTLSWPQLFQQAKLFTMVKDGYVFADKAMGLLTPSNLQFLQQLAGTLQSQRPKTAKSRPNANASKMYYRYAPPAHPFTAELQLAKKIKNKLNQLPAPPLPQLTLPNGSMQMLHPPKTPSMKPMMMPPFPFSGRPR